MLEEISSPKIVSVDKVESASTKLQPDKPQSIKSEVNKLTNVKSSLLPPQEIYQSKVLENGWDRVWVMYQKDECGLRSPELIYVAQGTILSGFTGALLGGYFGGKNAQKEFISKNEVTLFYGQNDGRRRLNDHIMLGTFRKAYYYGWRVSLFTAVYLLSTVTISTYRNKSSLLEYVAAGGISGAIFKFNLGLRGMISGSVIGAMLGFIPGVFTLSTMWLSGTTVQDVHYWRDQRKAKYKSEVQQRYEKIRLKTGSDVDLDPLMLAHDIRLKDENYMKEEKSN